MTSDGGFDGYFLLSVTGQIEKADFPLHDYIWCKYSFTCGQDWIKVAGIDEGMTQTSIKGCGCNRQNNLNFPIDISWKSTNPFGFLHAYGIDIFGKDVIRGYGAVHIPMKIGSHRRRVAIGEGRGVTKVHTQGFVDIIFNIAVKNLQI
ncbi:unnamed protein product [Heterobilharzia americana]|nr:unnamed protein product [Heterobilharzia americana]